MKSEHPSGAVEDDQPLTGQLRPPDDLACRHQNGSDNQQLTGLRNRLVLILRAGRNGHIPLPNFARDLSQPISDQPSPRSPLSPSPSPPLSTLDEADCAHLLEYAERAAICLAGYQTWRQDEDGVLPAGFDPAASPPKPWSISSNF